MSYAAPLSRLARSRVHADPHLSPRPNVVILSISAQCCKMAMQSVGQHRERRKLGQHAFENCDMSSRSFLCTFMAIFFFKKKSKHLSLHLLYRKFNRLTYNSLLLYKRKYRTNLEILIDNKMINEPLSSFREAMIFCRNVKLVETGYESAKFTSRATIFNECR